MSSLGTFRPERITQIADRFGVEGGPVLDNIVHGKGKIDEPSIENVLTSVPL